MVGNLKIIQVKIPLSLINIINQLGNGETNTEALIWLLHYFLRIKLKKLNLKLMKTRDKIFLSRLKIDANDAIKKIKRNSLKNDSGQLKYQKIDQSIDRIAKINKSLELEFRVMVQIKNKNREISIRSDSIILTRNLFFIIRRNFHSNSSALEEIIIKVLIECVTDIILTINETEIWENPSIEQQLQFRSAKKENPKKRSYLVMLNELEILNEKSQYIFNKRESLEKNTVYVNNILSNTLRTSESVHHARRRKLEELVNSNYPPHLNNLKNLKKMFSDLSENEK